MNKNIFFVIALASLAYGGYQYFQYNAVTGTNPLSSSTERYAKSIADTYASMPSFGAPDSLEFQKSLKQAAVSFGITDRDEIQHFLEVATAEAKKAQLALAN